MSERFRKTFPAPKGVREFKTITIQEVNGEDEMRAAMAAEARKGKTGRDWSPFIEMVRLSVVEIDGERPANGFEHFEKWSSKARNAVMTFYNDVNGLDEEDLKACVAAATATTMTKTTPTKDGENSVAPSGG